MTKNNFLIIRLGLVGRLIFSKIKSFRQSRVYSVSFIADLFWHSLAHSDGDLLVFSKALLSWDLGTLFKGLVSAHLLWHIIAHWVGNLLGLGLGHVLALIIGVILTCSRDWCPNLVVSVALPLIFTVLFVLC